MSTVNGHAATVEQLADQLGETTSAVRAHIGVLYRAGIVRRVDCEGRSRFELADWPTMWLVDQLAYRLRRRAAELDPDAGTCDLRERER